ncbi:hypothetical protein K3495_g566 [Podosphaera aphanis]|nr:hypothetical protein K3495_g566 [Podosphaera aphanis]
MGHPSNEWQTVGSRKRRDGTPIVEIANPVSEGTVQRGPGRPRKTSAQAVPDMSGTREKLLRTPNPPTSSTQKENKPRTVTRENMEELNRAPECEILS